MKYIYYSIVFLLFSFPVLGQELDSESIMAKAKIEVENGRYDNALSLIAPLREKFPQDEDLIIYAGRIYSWKKDYPKALEILLPLADKINPNQDALLATINTYYWSQQYEKCIVYCDKYLILNPNSTDVLLIKTECLLELNRDKEASEIIEKMYAADNSSPKISSLRTLLGRKAKNAIAISYLNISTYDPGQSPFHYGYVEYAHKFTKSSIVGRANVGHVYNDTQMLFEADYYQTFSKRNYLYVNAGLSTGETVFPVAKAGVEYYFAPQKRFDYSLGFRFLHFQNDDVTLLTGQLSYRAGVFTLAYRPYYDTANDLFSHVLSFQKTNDEKENLIRFELQYGNVPYLYLYNNFIEPLKAYRAGIQYQQRIGNSFFIRPVLLYEYEEYLPDEYRHRLNAQLIITKRF